MNASPRDLLESADDLLSKPPISVAGRRPVAVALLARQALEDALDALWRTKAPGMERCSTHAQLLCLPKYVDDPRLAHGVAHAWGALSRACHHHPYELPPSHVELRMWLHDVNRLVEETERTA